jgi:uncharacterized protein
MTMVFSAESASQALLGGALIGAAASLLLMFNGRIAGVSGILGGLFERERREWAWRALFIAGLLAGGLFFAWFHPDALRVDRTTSHVTTIAAGLLVGAGTRLAGGCTSGHGVCGISRLSTRSMAATGTFLVVGMLTVFLVRHGLGGSP